MTDQPTPGAKADEPRSQRQDSLTDQLADLMKLAVEHGMYDAHDWMRAQVSPQADEPGREEGEENLTTVLYRHSQDDIEAALRSLGYSVSLSPDTSQGECGARVKELVEAFTRLADKHHRTLTGSRKHDPENREWTECDCLSCAAAREALARFHATEAGQG